jgi:hypothetical protein
MPFVSAFVLATTVGLAGAQGTPEQTSADTQRGGFVPSERVRDDWMVSLEAVTRVPLEAGVQAGVEMPFGLRVFGGYGWVPAAYVNLVAGVAAGREQASVILDSAQYSGDSARFGLGIRPLRGFGGYFDASYAHVRLTATRDIAAFSVPGFTFPGGTYELRTGLDLWAVELGYEAELARRLVLAGALGLTGAFQSNTVIRPRGNAPNEEPALSEAAADVDHVFRTNLLPTLTLRIGFDLI